MPGGLLGALGDFFHRTYGPPAPAQPQQSQVQAQPPAQPQAQIQPQAQPQQPSPVPAFNDPIVSSLNQHLEQQHPNVPSEADQLKEEQNQAWAEYNFERCIVIFSRLHELEPDHPEWPDKLKVSYFNRGKQYETAGDVQHATQCYYAALQIDPNFPEAQQAAQQLLQQQGAPTGA
jgi:tetratricopeptide (TPR) repeat protein